MKGEYRMTSQRAFLKAFLVVFFVILVTIGPLPGNAQEPPQPPSPYEEPIASSGEHLNANLGEVINLPPNKPADQVQETNQVAADCTQIATFFVPTLNNPSGNINTINPLYDWIIPAEMNVDGMFFRMQVSSNSNFNNLEYSYTGGGFSGSFRFPWNLTAGMTYYWRGRLECDLNDRHGSYSATRSFRTASSGTLLPPPAHVGPYDGTRVHQNQVTLRWSPVGGAEEYLVRWRQVGSTRFSLRYVSGTDITLYGPSLILGATYEWWLATRNTYGLGFDSGIRRFTVVDSNYWPNFDGYLIRNTSRPRPSWQIFLDTFPDSNIQNNVATRWYWFWNYENLFDIGVCDGMSSTTLAYYEGAENLPSYRGVTYDLGSDVDWRLIEIYHGRQKSRGVLTHRTNLWNNNPGLQTIYNDIKSNLPHNSDNPIVLSFVPGPNSSAQNGHSVVPYRVQEQAGEWGRVYVYDSNHPNDMSKSIYFNFQAQPPTFDYDAGNGFHYRSNDGHVILLAPLSLFRGPESRVIAEEVLVVGRLGCAIDNNLCNFRVIDTQGQQFGNFQGVITNTIPNAGPIFDWYLPDHPSNGLGFNLPIGQYQTIIGEDVYIYTASTPSNIVRLETLGTPGQSSLLAPTANDDAILIDPNFAGIVYTTTKALSRGISFEVAIRDGDNSRLWSILNTTTGGPAQVQALSSGDVLNLEATGLISNFDLDIQGDHGWFIHRGITVTQSTAMTIIAPNLSPSGVVTVTVGLPGGPVQQIWHLENQLKVVYLPLATR